MDSNSYMGQYRDLMGQQNNLFNTYKTQQQNQDNQISNNINSYTGQRNQQMGDLQNQYGYNDKLKQLDQSYQALGNTQNILQTLPTDVNNRLMNSGETVTQGQRNRILGSEQTPITNQVGQLGNTINAQNQGFSNARGAINDALGFSDQQHQDLLNSLNSVRDLGYKNYLSGSNNIMSQADQAFKNYELFNQNEQSSRQRAFQAQEDALNRSLEMSKARLPYDSESNYAKMLADRGLNMQLNPINPSAQGTPIAISKDSPDQSFGGQLNRLGGNILNIPNGVGDIISNTLNMPNKYKLASNALGSNPLTNAFDGLGYTGLNLLGGLGFGPARQALGY